MKERRQVQTPIKKKSMYSYMNVKMYCIQDNFCLAVYRVTVQQVKIAVGKDCDFFIFAVD